MRLLIIASSLLALAAPALAQAPASDTIKAVTTRGIVISAQGFEIDVAYKADGTFSAMDGAVTGKWRADGDKLCSTSNFSPEEECVAYPLGKKSGDSFEVTGKQGAAAVTIK